MVAAWLWVAAFILNAALAATVRIAAPDQPVLSDREEYEYVGSHGFQANCPWSIYCYRVLVPMALERVPATPDTRWRAYQWVANTLAGTIAAGTVAGLSTGLPAAVLTSILVQTSFGFAFTAYDPYSAEPFVFLIAAIMLWCWTTDRWLVALVAGVVGVFAKETVALVSGAAALAALLHHRKTNWPPWVAQAALVSATLLGFHWIMDTYFGWSITANAAAKFSEGSWFALWWGHNPGLLRKGFFLFAPFGFAWFYAAAGFRWAPERIRQLAVGAALPFLALNYVQNPERALGNSFFFVVPLATFALLRVPLPVAMTAVVANGLFTMRIGTSSEWLPSTKYLLPLAAVSAVWVFWHLRSAHAAGRQQ